MSGEPILLETEGRIGKIIFNRPENRNSMNRETMPAFQRAVNQVKENRDLRCLVITGSGSSFCGGGDFRSTLESSPGKRMNDLLMEMYRPFLDVGKLEMPVIAAMNGHAIGGGLGLALVCDIRIANKNARYGANFARLGFHAGMAVSYLLPRLIGLARANELLFTGRIISGETAADIGLVNYAVEPEEVLPKSMELAEEIECGAPTAIRMMKRSIYRSLEWNPTNAAEMESICQAQTFEMEDAKEGIQALLEKRDPVFTNR